MQAGQLTHGSGRARLGYLTPARRVLSGDLGGGERSSVGLGLDLAGGRREPGPLP